MVIDPVCNMKIDRSTVRWALVYGGKEYFFCSEGCMAEFQRHPEDYQERTSDCEQGNKHV